MTAADLIYQAARTAGIIGAGETPTTDETTDMLETFRQLLDAWSAEELLMHATRTAVITTVDGTVSYTISGARPAKILSADAVISGVNQPVAVLGPDAWAARPDKSDKASLPKALYCDYAYTTPAVLLAPIPSAVATVNLYCAVAMTALAAATSTVFAAPEGFVMALRFNLAVALCPEFGRPVDPAVAAVAAQTKAALKTLIASNRAGQSALAVPPVPGGSN